jgi:hypothetical protein
MSEEDEQVSVPQTEDVKPSSESSTEQAVQEADSAASVQSSAPDYSREALIKQLTQPDPVEPEPEAEVAEVEAPEAEDDESEDEPEAVATKKQTADDEVLADPSVPDKTKKSITRLRDKAKFGELITEVLTDAKIAPEEFTRWTNLAARLKKGDPTAVTELIATAKNFGYKEPVITAPAEDAEPDVDGLAERIYKKEFSEDVEALEITEEVARKHARKAAESAVKSRPVREEPAHSNSKQAPAQMDPIRDRALAAVVNMENQYRATVSNWKDIESKVAERMIKEHSNSDPLMWTAGMQQIVTEEIRKSRPAAPAAKPAIKPIGETNIRPQPAGGKSVPVMSDRDKAIAMLTGGKIR